MFGAGSYSHCLGQPYEVYVAAESEDVVHVVQFDGIRAHVKKTIRVGTLPTEMEGPHGLTVSPDGNHWYLSLAHGQPYGKVVKYETGSDRVRGVVELGFFPATLHISKLTGLLYVANFDLHGGRDTGYISVVDPNAMVEIGRIETGAMPHGSRTSSDGRYHYSVSMMSGELYQLDAQSLTIANRMPTATEPGGKPTWVEPHPDRPLVYVANNGADEIIEVDVEAWQVTRRFEAPGAPYNVAVSPDGSHLIATNKGEGTTAIFDITLGSELARIPNSRRIPHGIAISEDGSYAFISVEGVGAEPGAVDVIDTRALRRVASVDTGRQAGGIVLIK